MINKRNKKLLKTINNYLYKAVKIVVVACWLVLLTYGLTHLYKYLLEQHYANIFAIHPEYIAKDFTFPVGKKNTNGYYIAQKFTQNDHLGDDWNAVTGGNTDLGDPIYSIANGYVTMAKDFGGNWGKVVKIIHYYDGRFVESLYAHCDEILVVKGNLVSKKEQIATIGNSEGRYYAHLHLELRDQINLPLGYGYGTNLKGYLNPLEFIKAND